MPTDIITITKIGESQTLTIQKPASGLSLVGRIRIPGDKSISHRALMLGAIASGDEDVLSADRRLELHGQTRALAVAWEGAGAARACILQNIPFCEIRAITDVGSTSLNKDWKSNLELAMSKLSEVFLEVF